MIDTKSVKSVVKDVLVTTYMKETSVIISVASVVAVVVETGTTYISNTSNTVMATTIVMEVEENM